MPPFTQVDSNYLNTITFGGFSDNIEKLYLDFLKTYQPEAQGFFQSMNVGETAETVKRFDEQDMSQYAHDKPQGADALRLTFGVGYTKSAFAQRFGAQLQVSYEMRVAKRFELSKAIQRFLNSVPARMELDTQHQITFQNATSYVNMDGRLVDVTAGDGLSYINTTHPLAFSATTWSNLVPGSPQLSLTAIFAAQTLFITDILDNFGLPVTMDPTHLIVNKQDPNTVHQAYEILRSTTLVTQANPAVVNPLNGMTYGGMYELMVLSRVATTATGATDTTKSKWWSLVAMKGLNRLQSYEVIWEAPHMNPQPNGSNNGVDVYNDDWTFGARARYAHCIVSTRGWVASQAV